MKKICTSGCLILLLLFGGCQSKENLHESKSYNVKADEYSSFIQMPIDNLSEENDNISCNIIKLYNNVSISQNQILEDYCLYNDYIIALFSDGLEYTFYRIDNNSAEEICDYPTDESIEVNDMCHANNTIFWVETGYNSEEKVMCIDMNDDEKKVSKINSDFSTQQCIRINSDEKNIYCSEYTEDTQKWSICKYENGDLLEYKSDILVQNQYSPFSIGSGCLQYMVLSDNAINLMVEDLSNHNETAVNLGVNPQTTGIRTIPCNTDYIAWNDIKNVTDYSSVSTVIYDTEENRTLSAMVSLGIKNLSSLRSGIIGDKMFIHFTSDFNGCSNFYVYDINKEISYNLTDNNDTNVYFTYPKVINNTVTFCKILNGQADSIYALKL